MVLYAIVDIETTGGHASGNGITEIAIRVHDGINVIHTYDTLINPRKPIPLSIQALTGINDMMLSDAPYFEDVADSIFKLLSDKIFVAHAVNFDYSFLKFHLAQCGYELNVPKLCTVRLSRKLKPGLNSYSLGKLCDSLQIPLYNRHRAGGDADATAILFTQLVADDAIGCIESMLKKTSKEQILPPHLPKSDFDNLPSSPGVYYLCNKEGKTLYVGKAVNIKKRVVSHFTGYNPNQQRQHFLRDIYSIRFETCGTELMALLLEASEIKRLWPPYNRALKNVEPKYALYCYEDLNGLLRLVVGKYNKQTTAIHVLYRHWDGTNMLHQLVREYNLCPELCKIGSCKNDDCICNSKDDIIIKEYNDRVCNAINNLSGNLLSFAIIDKGKSNEQRSCVWVENGAFYGMGYIDDDSDLTNLEDVKTTLTRYQDGRYMMQMIYQYAEKYPETVVQFTKENNYKPNTSFIE